MAKDVVSLLIYQIDGNKLKTAQVFGIPVAQINRVMRPTRIGSTWARTEKTVDESIYKFISAGVPVKNGRQGFKTYYTNKTIADIISDINT
jgi:hypothetical protein